MRITAFWGGALSGVALFACGASAVYLLVRDRPPAPPYNFEASTSGTDLSRHGARTVEIVTTYAPLMRQTCNGVCDDLSYKLKVEGENGLSILVRDQAGACLSCDGGAYVDSASRHVAVVHVGGFEKLQATGEYLWLQPDGSMKPTRTVGESRAKADSKP